MSESKFIIGQPVEAQPSTTASKSEYDRSAAESLSTALARRCPWPTCVADKFRFQSDSEAEVHFRLHQNDLLKAWNGPTKCNWPNCSSSRLFKETSDFKSHLNNIHVAPLHCPVAECSRLEPFGKQCDLDRHVKNIHQGLRVFCPIKTCESNSYGFARKHNLVKHMREEHDNIMSGALLITAAPRFLMENKNRISRMLTGTMNAL
jgi:hypothetical protein